MLWWMHRHARALRTTIETRIASVGSSSRGQRRERWGIGAFAFLMLFREGAEAVMFLAAVNLTTESVLAFIGTLLGLAAAIAFGVMFVKGSVKVDLRRFFAVTEAVLLIFVAQLFINGYHEFSEIGLLPATPRSMGIIGPIVRNNTLFVIALVAIPLFIWLSRKPTAAASVSGLSPAEARLARARARRERFFRYGAVASTLLVLLPVGVVYAMELLPKEVPPPEPAPADADSVAIPLERFADGKLHRFSAILDGRVVRFLVLKTADGKVRTTLDACEMCGAFGYIQDEKTGHLICLNCGAEIDPLTMGHSGGCNPIPLHSVTDAGAVRVALLDLEKEAHRFNVAKQELVAVDPVCGMRVPVSEASAFENYNGKTYYFCRAHGDRCHQQFKEHPEKFAR